MTDLAFQIKEAVQMQNAPNDSEGPMKNWCVRIIEWHRYGIHRTGWGQAYREMIISLPYVRFIKGVFRQLSEAGT